MMSEGRDTSAQYRGPRFQGWRTPADLFEPMDAEFRFDLDGAATAEDRLLPDHSEYALSWVGRRVFCNPPWNQMPAFVELAGTAEVAVLLVPARVNARWFHRALELGAEVRYFLGRPSFGHGLRAGRPDSERSFSPVDCLFLIFRTTPEAAPEEGTP